MQVALSARVRGDVIAVSSIIMGQVGSHIVEHSELESMEEHKLLALRLEGKQETSRLPLQFSGAELAAPDRNTVRKHTLVRRATQVGQT